MVMRAMALSLGLPENFFDAQLIDDSYWIMRVIGYPPLDGVPADQASFVEVSVIGYPPLDGCACLPGVACDSVGHGLWFAIAESIGGSLSEALVSNLIDINCKCGKWGPHTPQPRHAMAQ
jgi:hypothetical protein